MIEYQVDIERPSGTFTAFYGYNKNFTAAQKECAKHGQILAPITEKEDFDAIVEVLSAENEYNVITGRDFWEYIVGLEAAYDNSKKVFMNGVEFDEEKHGSFYKDDQENQLGKNGNCPLALLWPENPSFINVKYTYCESEGYSYICFKPKNKPCLSSDALVGESSVSKTEVRNSFVAGFGTCTLIICAVYFVFKSFYQTKE